jgi:hypothetical protein
MKSKNYDLLLNTHFEITDRPVYVIACVKGKR